MDFFCLPIVFGCTTKISQDGDPSPRVCPRCHNASVYQSKSREWFALFWIPLIPTNSQHIWYCTICQWQVPLQQGWEPMHPVGGFPQDGQSWQQQGWQTGPGSTVPQTNSGYGYGPTYINSSRK